MKLDADTCTQMFMNNSLKNMDEYKEFSKETFQRKNFPEKVPKLKNHAIITENTTNNTADNSSKTPKVIILSNISKLLRNESPLMQKV